MQMSQKSVFCDICVLFKFKMTNADGYKFAHTTYCIDFEDFLFFPLYNVVL